LRYIPLTLLAGAIALLCDPRRPTGTRRGPSPRDSPYGLAIFALSRCVGERDAGGGGGVEEREEQRLLGVVVACVATGVLWSIIICANSLVDYIYMLTDNALLILVSVHYLCIKADAAPSPSHF
jgi:hypothetical protein